MCLCLYMKYMKFGNYDIYERHLLWLCFFYMKDETIKYIIMVIINRYLLWLCLYIELYILITFFFFFEKVYSYHLIEGLIFSFFFIFFFEKQTHTREWKYSFNQGFKNWTGPAYPTGWTRNRRPVRSRKNG